MIVKNRILTTVLALLVIGALAALIYLVTQPSREKFTEFYILNASGEASGYPTQLSVGEETEVTLGIVNHESKAVEYSVVIAFDDAFYDEIDGITLNNGETWEDLVGLTANTAGESQNIHFSLYKEAEDDPYITLRLIVDVI